MFIGGLNWETTEGTRSRTVPLKHVVICSGSTSIECRRLTLIRLSQELLHPVRRGQRVHRHARLRNWSLTRIWLLDFQGPEMRQYCYGQGALP